MKYYFVTLQAKSRSGDIQYWNDVINISPMQYVTDNIEAEENASISSYYDYCITNTLEISEEEYNKWKNEF